MILYFSIVILSIIIAYTAEKRNSVTWMFSSVISISLLAGLRDLSVGTDTYTYFRIFNNLANEGTSFVEPGFAFICRLLMELLGDARALFIFFAFIINILIVGRLWELRDRASFGYMFFLYVTIFFPQSMNILRQYLAVAIIFYATHYLEKFQYIRFLILNVVAFTIHFSSAIVLVLILPYYYVQTKGITKKKILLTLLLIGLTPVILWIYILVYGEYEVYLESTSENIGLLVVFRIGLIILFALLMKIPNTHLPNSKKREDLFKVISTVYIIAVALSFMGSFYEYVGRISIYFMIFEVPFAAIISRMEKKRVFNILYTFLALYFLIVKTGILGESGIMPYKLYMFAI